MKSIIRSNGIKASEVIGGFLLSKNMGFPLIKKS
jgi:hypothetical protein